MEYKIICYNTVRNKEIYSYFDFLTKEKYYDTLKMYLDRIGDLCRFDRYYRLCLKIVDSKGKQFHRIRVIRNEIMKNV